MKRLRDGARPASLPRLCGLAAILLSSAWTVLPARADEIRFRTGAGAQAGTVLEESDGTVTVRFPRDAIESISRDAAPNAGRPPQPAAPGLEKRVRELERRMESLPAAAAVAPARREGGDVQGTIRWKDRPLPRAPVLLVPAQYAGRPPARKDVAEPVAAALAPEPEGSFRTTTDDAGRYRFERVPPGRYLIYWMPDAQTGWVKRLRDRADLVVAGDGVVDLDIPEKRK